MASLPYPRTPLPPRLHPSFPRLAPLFLPLHALLSPRSPHLFSSSYSLLLSSASTDADARIYRRRHPHRPTQTSAPTDADIRTDRRGCSYRPTRMNFVDVSQCQTVTFVLPTVAFAVQDLPFHISLPLFLSISSSVLLNQRCFSVVCILWLQPLNQSLSPIII